MMFRCRFAFGAALLAVTTVLAAPAARAEYEQQAAMTKAFALKGAEYSHSVGFDAARAGFPADKGWFRGPDEYNLHVSAIANDQVVWADTGFPEVVGLSYADIGDLDGVPLGKSVLDGLARSPDGAALQLRFSNPVTKKVAHTEGYCLRVDPANVLCAWSQTN